MAQKVKDSLWESALSLHHAGSRGLSSGPRVWQPLPSPAQPSCQASLMVVTLALPLLFHISICRRKRRNANESPAFTCLIRSEVNNEPFTCVSVRPHHFSVVLLKHPQGLLQFQPRQHTLNSVLLSQTRKTPLAIECHHHHHPWEKQRHKEEIRTKAARLYPSPGLRKGMAEKEPGIHHCHQPF